MVTIWFYLGDKTAYAVQLSWVVSGNDEENVRAKTLQERVIVAKCVGSQTEHIVIGHEFVHSKNASCSLDR